MTYHVQQGDCREELKALKDNSINAIVCDPPYEINFMSRKWDNTGIAYDIKVWKECLRVLKPGGHLLAFGGTRTYHRVACAIEGAGFEIRDSILWVYGSGMPKSLNISKEIDKIKGTSDKREVVHEYKAGGNAGTSCKEKGGTYSVGVKNSEPVKLTVSKGGCEESKQWDGFGTGLKPAHEPCVLARKPIEGTIAKNVLKHGTGGLNIDGCRIGTDWNEPDRPQSWKNLGHSKKPEAEKIAAPPGTGIQCHPQGRWATNIIFSHLDGCQKVEEVWDCVDGCPVVKLNKSARFFYCTKAGRKEREAGLDNLPVYSASELVERKPDSKGINNPRAGTGRTSDGRRNNHPTVKPIDLMRYMVRLVTPTGGIVLDPFCGSGTTGIACVLEGFHFFGIELKEGYCKIARARIAHHVPRQGKFL